LVLKQLYKQLIEPHVNDLPKSLDEGLERMCQHTKMAYVASDVFIRFAQSKRTCSFMSIDKASYFLTESLVISKKSPYKRIFKAKYVLSPAFRPDPSLAHEEHGKT
jgi:hypothetical protein